MTVPCFIQAIVDEGIVTYLMACVFLWNKKCCCIIGDTSLSQRLPYNKLDKFLGQRTGIFYATIAYLFLSIFNYKSECRQLSYRDWLIYCQIILSLCNIQVISLWGTTQWGGHSASFKLYANPVAQLISLREFSHVNAEALLPDLVESGIQSLLTSSFSLGTQTISRRKNVVIEHLSLSLENDNLCQLKK